MPSQFEKLEAHASHLLDGFLRLRERYAFLDPMLFSEEVANRRGSGRQARGFITLRHSLFLSCAQDIAKLALDKDPRTPSIRNLIESVQVQSTADELRDRFAVWVLPSIEVETDPEIIAALERIELGEQKARRLQFDDILTGAVRRWNELTTAPYINGFLTIRDKVTAHTEVRHVADKYQPIDIKDLGLKWSDVKRAIDEMQELVEALGMLIRNAGFAWDMLDEQLNSASKEFWLQSDAAA